MANPLLNHSSAALSARNLIEELNQAADTAGTTAAVKVAMGISLTEKVPSLITAKVSQSTDAMTVTKEP